MIDDYNNLDFTFTHSQYLVDSVEDFYYQSLSINRCNYLSNNIIIQSLHSKSSSN